MTERRHDRNAVFRARDGHVEPAFAAVLQQRPESVHHLSRTIGPVSYGKYDRVPLVALNAFKVLHEKPLEFVLREEFVEVGPHLKFISQRLLNPTSMLDTHRDHAERFFWALLGMLQNEFHYALHFSR